MPETPDILRERGLFVFDQAAMGEIVGGFSELVEGGAEVQPVDELVCLTAAEYSLSRWFSYPEPLLPIRSPFQVEHGDALAAFLKTNCNPVFCMEPVRASLTLADVVAFSSDLVKLGWVDLHEIPEDNVIGELLEAVNRLEWEHQRAPSERARALAASGVLRLQGFLWTVKAFLPADDLHEAVARAYEAFELSQPVGAVSPG